MKSRLQKRLALHTMNGIKIDGAKQQRHAASADEPRLFPPNGSRCFDEKNVVDRGGGEAGGKSGATSQAHVRARWCRCASQPKSPEPVLERELAALAGPDAEPREDSTVGQGCL